ncbi:MAG: CHRD domain-containing protein [Pseudomonadota bacterium]|nr:CHRD domain-containing protein [Pseudomonadota bacterium]
MMARRIVLSAALAAALAAAGCSMMDSSMNRPTMAGNTMAVALSPGNEVPPNSSGGSGSAKVSLDANVLTWTITYSGLTGPVTAGHFHGPAQPGVNAGVVVPFTGSLASPITGTATLTAEQVGQVKAGLWYINLHTATAPGGEIRGQVK